MDCILNELSLNGQYKDIDDFEKSGVKPLSAVLHDMSVLGIDLLYKKSDFYNSNVTSNETFYSIIFSRAAKVNDSMRRMKSQGNTINGVFYVLRFDLDHKLSDLG